MITNNISKNLPQIVFLSVTHPIIILINFFVIIQNFATHTGTNTVQLKGWSIMLWFISAIILAALVFLIQYKLIEVFKKISIEDFQSINFKGNLAYIPFIIFTLFFVFSEIEGNIMGFIIIPAFLLLFLVSVPIAITIKIILLKKKNQ